jgi:hypothetical protein
VQNGYKSFQEGKRRIDTKQEQIEKNQSDPMDSARKLVEHDRPGTKNCPSNGHDTAIDNVR